jgi:hypothetical protein
MIKKIIWLYSFIILAIPFQSIYAQFSVDLETGIAYNTMNDVRIPGDKGTYFSLADDLKSDPTFFFRAKLHFHLNDRNTFSLLIAPLTIKPEGQIAKDVQFAGGTFPVNSNIYAKYRFNSYRLAYRYRLFDWNTAELHIGLTAKIRDAEIRLTSGNLDAQKSNVGFVPLINFKFFWQFHDSFGLLLDGDALAAPQGRAEDVLLAFTYNIREKSRVKVGYRILEGGADNDEVYSFALINYAVVGLVFRF